MQINKKSLFITGATGFIGSHLISELTEKYQVTSLVSLSQKGKHWFPANVFVERVNLENTRKIKEILSRIEPKIIIHLAAVTPVRYSFENPHLYQKINYLATTHLLEVAAKIKNFEKFIFASTMETYGYQAARKPFTEDLSLNPDSPYAVSKVAAEKYIQMISRATGLPAIILKPCNTFGRKNETNYLVEYIITSMLKKEKPQLGTPGAVRDLMYVTDHVAAYLKALDFLLPSRDEMKQILEKDSTAFTFNIGNGLEFTVREVAQKIGEMIGFRRGIKTGFPENYPYRPSVAPYLSLNASKAQRLLKWKPEVSLEEGLQKTIEYWKGKSLL